MSDVSFSCDNLNFTLVSVGGLPRLFSPFFDSFFFTFSMDVVSDLLEGEHTDEESDSTVELRSELLRGRPRGFRGLDLTEMEVENAENIKFLQVWDKHYPGHPSIYSVISHTPHTFQIINKQKHYM